MRLSGALSLAACLALLGWGPNAKPATAQPVDPFYTALYEDGLRSYRAADYTNASEELRVAAFGLLDHPEQLTRALAYLALSESARGAADGFFDAHRRLTELEERFGTVSGGALRLTVRAALDEAIRTHGPEGGLRPDAEIVAATEAVTRAAARTTEDHATVCISWDGTDDCQATEEAVTSEIDTTRESPEPAPVVPTSPGPDELAVFSRLDETANGKRSTKKLREALEEALPIATRFPKWEELQQVTGLLAGRSGDYPTAIAHYDRAGSIEDSPLDLYYLAIALYESGRAEEADAKLRQALPELEQNREVRRNVRKILSDGGLQ